jgi:hypothetical protein
MTFAAFDGQVLNLKFNEPVSIANSPRLTFIDPKKVNGDISLQLTAANTTVDPTGMISVDLSKSAPAVSAGMLRNMVDTPENSKDNDTYVYIEDSAYYLSSNYTQKNPPQSGDRLGHGILDYSDIQDIRGNSWADWIDYTNDGSYADRLDKYSDMANSTADINRRVAFVNPRFAVVDALGIFRSDINVAGYDSLVNGVDSSSALQTVSITFSHPVDWNRGDGLNVGSGLSDLDKLNAFYSIGNNSGFKDNGVDNGTDGMITISEDERTLTIKFRTRAPVANNIAATLSLQTGKFYTSTLTGQNEVKGAGTSISPKK